MKVKLQHRSIETRTTIQKLAVPSAVGLSTLLAAALVYGGYVYGSHKAPTGLLSQWQQEIQLQRLEMESAEGEIQANLDALTQRIGLLQAHIGRLDALGTRLVSMAKLKNNEFDFTTPPGLGGPEDMMVNEDASSAEINKVLETLELALIEREQQLEILSERIFGDSLESQVKPSGFPVPGGWVSSKYGYRADPFSGRRSFHKGVDIAAKEGKLVTSAAGGIVKRAEAHPQYGLLVEVDHGNGYTTLYAHASTLLVSAGDIIKKGTPIATVGSTGRSTGPHLHFEVIKEGRHVDPSLFLKKES